MITTQDLGILGAAQHYKKMKRGVNVQLNLSDDSIKFVKQTAKRLKVSPNAVIYYFVIKYIEEVKS